MSAIKQEKVFWSQEWLKAFEYALAMHHFLRLSSRKVSVNANYSWLPDDPECPTGPGQEYHDGWSVWVETESAANNRIQDSWGVPARDFAL